MTATSMCSNFGGFRCSPCNKLYEDSAKFAEGCRGAQRTSKPRSPCYGLIRHCIEDCVILSHG